MGHFDFAEGPQQLYRVEELPAGMTKDCFEIATLQSASTQITMQ